MTHEEFSKEMESILNFHKDCYETAKKIIKRITSQFKIAKISLSRLDTPYYFIDFGLGYFKTIGFDKQGNLEISITEDTLDKIDYCIDFNTATWDNVLLSDLMDELFLLDKATSSDSMFYSIHKDAQNKKHIHIYGNLWSDDGRIALTEYTSLIMPLEDFVKSMNDDKDFLNKIIENCKQYEEDLTPETALSTLMTYFDGNDADYGLSLEKVTPETDCGNYIG